MKEGESKRGAYARLVGGLVLVVGPKVLDVPGHEGGDDKGLGHLLVPACVCVCVFACVRVWGEAGRGRVKRGIEYGKHTRQSRTRREISPTYTFKSSSRNLADPSGEALDR
jgi:hypothetical protein